jgi:hypothetical protein
MREAPWLRYDALDLEVESLRMLHALERLHVKLAFKLPETATSQR